VLIDRWMTANCRRLLTTAQSVEAWGALRDGIIAQTFSGSVLLFAGAAKAHTLATDPVPNVFFWGRGLDVTLIAVEFFFAAWLLTGLHGKACRWGLIVTFCAFASGSLAMALAKVESCGCFGHLRITPWSTLLLDTVLLAALWLWAPGANVGKYTSAARPRIRGLFAALIVAITLSLSFYAVSFAPNAHMLDDDITVTDGDIAVLEPDKWIGKLFPLLPFIDFEKPLLTGDWTVVLYHHDCKQCQEALPRYIDTFTEFAASRNAKGLALIEVPPFSSPLDHYSPVFHHARLSTAIEWFIKTPAEIQLKDGKVVANE